MTWKEVIYALLAAIIILFLFTAWGAPVVKLVRDLGVKMSLISPPPETPDTYALCDPMKTIIVTVDKPKDEDPNAFFTYGMQALEKDVDSDEIVLRFSPVIDQALDATKVVKVYVSNNWYMRPTGETEWKEFTSATIPTYKVVGGMSEITIKDLPDDYILLVLTDEPISGTKRICKSQREISMEIDT